MKIETETVEACPLCGNGESSIIVTIRDFGCHSCENEFTFVRCFVCGVSYLRDRPTDSAMNVIYPVEYTAFDPSAAGKAKSDNRLRQFCARLVQFARNIEQCKKYRALMSLGIPEGKVGAIVELGCGAGELLLAMKSD